MFRPLKINIIPFDSADNLKLNNDVAGLIVQYPNTEGAILDYSSLVESVKEKKVFLL